MLIEYKIKFEKDGLTIAQHIEPNSVPVIHAAASKAPVNGLPATQKEARTLTPANPLAKIDAGTGGPPPDVGTGGPPPDVGTGGPPPDVGTGGSGYAPIFILGPIIFGGSAPQDLAKPIDSAQLSSPPKTFSAKAGE